MVIFNSYVSLPEGRFNRSSKKFRSRSSQPMTRWSSNGPVSQQQVNMQRWGRWKPWPIGLARTKDSSITPDLWLMAPAYHESIWVVDHCNTKMIMIYFDNFWYIYIYILCIYIYIDMFHWLSRPSRQRAWGSYINVLLLFDVQTFTFWI